MTSAPISPLRQRMIDDMRLRQFGECTQQHYVREVAAFARFLGRSPDQAEPEDLRRYQLRAGLTERTFFRHFPDKREVLFQGQSLLDAALSQAIAEAAPELSPLETLRFAFAVVAEMLEQNSGFSEPRRRIIAATPALQEREVAKHAAITRAVGEALRKRDVEARRADLAAHAGMAVLGYALDAWFAAPSTRLADHLDRAFAELQYLASPTDR